MPFYLYYCMKCGAEREDMRLIADRRTGPKCDHCSAPMTLQLTPPTVIVKNPAVPRSKS